jgi:glycosyltransferase 2 family protein
MLNNAASWGQVYHIQNIGYMLTQLLPLRLGDVARAVLIGSVPPITIAQSVSTMVVERILDLLFFIVLLPFTLSEVEALPTWMQSYARGLGVASLGIIAVLIIAANQRPFIQRITTFIFDRLPFFNTENWVIRVDGLLAGLNSLTNPRDGLVLIFLSIIVWIPVLFAYQMALTAVYIQTTWIMTAFVVCAAAFSVAAPSSPGQVGVFHAAVTFALVQVLQQPEGASASFAFLYHAMNMVLMISLGLIGLFRTGATFSHVVASARRFRQKTTT